MRQPMVLPDGLFSWAELEVLQSALRVFIYQVEGYEDMPPEFMRFLEELEDKMLKERGRLLNEPVVNRREIAVLLGPSARENEIEQMVTTARYCFMQRNPRYLQWASERNLLPYMEDQMEAMKVAVTAKTEEENGNGTHHN